MDSVGGCGGIRHDGELFDRSEVRRFASFEYSDSTGKDRKMSDTEVGRGENQVDLRRRIEDLEKKTGLDRWVQIQFFGSLAVMVVIAVVGWSITTSLADRQIKIAQDFQRLEKLEEVYAARHSINHVVTDLKEKADDDELTDLQDVVRMAHTAFLKASLYASKECRDKILALEEHCKEFCLDVEKQKRVQAPISDVKVTEATAPANTPVTTIQIAWNTLNAELQHVLSVLCEEAGLDPLGK